MTCATAVSCVPLLFNITTWSLVPLAKAVKAMATSPLLCSCAAVAMSPPLASAARLAKLAMPPLPQLLSSLPVGRILATAGAAVAPLQALNTPPGM